ncbi:MAG: hypothetical protein E6G94_10005 [Alphaproteobacteria bacterium]|nr:MAG: hypothetical protein E6G94_10005 [Alphaproteobacteria bacterium]
MSLVIIAMLASSQALPWIDRSSLERQARAESLRPAAVALGVNRASQPTARRILNQDVGAISTVCRAAAKANNPNEFIGRLGEAFAMPNGEVASLRKTCGVYLAGMIDGQQ